jgi:DNA recombination protein RmuC
MDLDYASLFVGIVIGSGIIWLLRGTRIAGLEGELDALKRQPDKSGEDRETLLLAVKDVTQEVLDKRSESLVKTNEKKIGDLLKPLNQDIKDFKKKLEEDGKTTAEKHGALRQQIGELKELNAQIGEEARGLTLALKGESKTQGNWGEVVLERVLELSGLVEGREFEREVTETDADGKRKRPDVIVNLPGNRQVVIDSKVSITAYEKYCTTEDDKERAQALNAHIASIKSHVKGLSGKSYQHLGVLNTPDYVLMFMPIDAALTEALRADREIFNDAIARRIVLVTPTTLLATLRTIETIWKSERQTKNVLEIARQAGGLHDKFVAFVADVESIGKRVNQTSDAYEAAMNKLTSGKGNLIGRVQKLDELGAKTSKKFPGHLVDDELTPQAPQGLFPAEEESPGEVAATEE